MERSSSSIRRGSNPLAKSLRGSRRLSAPVSATALSSGGGAAARAAAGGAPADVAERDAFERGQVFEDDLEGPLAEMRMKESYIAIINGKPEKNKNKPGIS